MTTRTDVVPTYATSPRVLEVQSPSTEMTMQDLVDTARKLEDSFQGMTHAKLIDASGKEDLGGGVSVGITVAMQDTKLAFQGRTTPAESGTVTSAPGDTRSGLDSFIDSSADFVAAGIQRGSLVINFTDQSIADVVEVTSATQLVTKNLVNGISNSYSVSDAYQIYNIVQCSATGGNLTAVDSLSATMAQILPTAFTQVVLTASSSATTQSQTQLEYSTYNEVVSVKPSSPYSGTSYPVGTPGTPVNNIADALTIAQSTGLTTFKFMESVTITGINLSGYKLQGLSEATTVLTLDPSAVLTNCEITNSTITGTLDGGTILKNCVINQLRYINGFVYGCMLNPVTITLGGTEAAHFLNCYSSTGTPIIDCDGTGAEPTPLVMQNYSGHIKLIELTQGQNVNINFSAGDLVIDSTCTNGVVEVAGDGHVTNDLGVHLLSGTYNGNLELDNDAIYGEHLHDVWIRMGLDKNTPVINRTDGSYTAGSIDVGASEDGSGNITHQRN